MKNLRKEIEDYASGLPEQIMSDTDKTMILKIGTKYVTLCSMYEGSKTYKMTLEDFFKNYLDTSERDTYYASLEKSYI
jgi:hypothetical protein